MAADAQITAADVASRSIPDLTNWADIALMAEIKFVIPTYDRPDRLCTSTLAMLRKHGIPMKQVGVFVFPGIVRGQSAPEWQRYLEALKTHNFTDVHLLQGGVGLEGNMAAALRWVQQGYFVTLSDSVKDLLQVTGPAEGRSLRPASPGCLKALIMHGYSLMIAGGFTAWSVNPIHNAPRMPHNTISRKLGLLDGNLCGCILPEKWKTLQVDTGMGLVYDVAWSLQLWAAGHRFFRYGGFCMDHRYRTAGGQATLFRTPESRRSLENQCLEELARKWPALVSFTKDSSKSLKTMQYRFRTVGPGPLLLRRGRQVGRPRKYHENKGSSSTERWQLWKVRNGKKTKKTKFNKCTRAARKRPAAST